MRPKRQKGLASKNSGFYRFPWSLRMRPKRQKGNGCTHRDLVSQTLLLTPKKGMLGWPNNSLSERLNEMANPNPNQENLTPFPPGQSGNPGGVPKRGPRKNILRKALLDLIAEKGLEREFVQVGMTLALGGQYNFWREVFDRVDGPVQKEASDEADMVAVATALRDRINQSRQSEAAPDA